MLCNATLAIGLRESTERVIRLRGTGCSTRHVDQNRNVTGRSENLDFTGCTEGVPLGSFMATQKNDASAVSRMTSNTEEQLEALLLEGLQGEETRMTRADWQAIRREAVARTVSTAVPNRGRQ